MRFPKSWDDRSILDDSDFKELMDMRTMLGSEQQTRRAKGQTREGTNEILLACLREQVEFGEQAGQAWIDIAFNSDGDQRVSIGKDRRIPADDGLLLLFIEVFHILSTPGPRARDKARLRIDDERRRRGFGYQLSSKVVPSGAAVRNNNSPNGISKKSSNAKGTPPRKRPRIRCHKPLGVQIKDETNQSGQGQLIGSTSTTPSASIPRRGSDMDISEDDSPLPPLTNDFASGTRTQARRGSKKVVPKLVDRGVESNSDYNTPSSGSIPTRTTSANLEDKRAAQKKSIGHLRFNKNSKVDNASGAQSEVSSPAIRPSGMQEKHPDFPLQLDAADANYNIILATEAMGGSARVNATLHADSVDIEKNKMNIDQPVAPTCEKLEVIAPVQPGPAGVERSSSGPAMKATAADAMDVDVQPSKKSKGKRRKEVKQQKKRAYGKSKQGFEPQLDLPRKDGNEGDGVTLRSAKRARIEGSSYSSLPRVAGPESQANVSVQDDDSSIGAKPVVSEDAVENRLQQFIPTPDQPTNAGQRQGGVDWPSGESTEPNSPGGNMSDARPHAHCPKVARATRKWPPDGWQCPLLLTCTMPPQRGPVEGPEMSGPAVLLPDSSLDTPATASRLLLSNEIAVSNELLPRYEDILIEHNSVLPSAERPALPRLPPIWAQSRQEVCETFEWFKSYQGGVYFTKNVVKGYLLSAFSSSRDLFHYNGKIVISHGGGKAESIHSHHGRRETEQAQDQMAQDKSVRALLQNYKDQTPLVLLIDEKYTLFPYDLQSRGCTYAVLGFYQIIHAWAEYQTARTDEGRVVRYKFTFQWCEGQGEPWWLSSSGPSEEPASTSFPGVGLKVSSDASPSASMAPTNEQSLPATPLPRKLRPWDDYPGCLRCKTTSPHVYSTGWMCLNPECPSFCLIPQGAREAEKLDYAENFVKLLPLRPISCSALGLRPCLPEEAEDGHTTTYAFTRGWHCPKCGRLSSRFKWEHWECSSCGAIRHVKPRIRPAREFYRQNPNGKDHIVAPYSGITTPGCVVYHHEQCTSISQTFDLPHSRGKIHVIQGSARGNGEANEIFEEYQSQANTGELRFRRWPLRAHKLRTPMLTNYFSQNSGEPYQYVGGSANTVPFDQAPSAVVRALNLIKARMNSALNLSAPFNEILSAGYFERQKMAFHSDAEKGLGPVVASLSLGSSATMHFRLHSQFEDPTQDIEGRNALTLFLKHGDVMVMEGADVQKYYEHTVVPVNFRIAATARCIDPTNNTEVKPKLLRFDTPTVPV